MNETEGKKRVRLVVALARARNELSWAMADEVALVDGASERVAKCRERVRKLAKGLSELKAGEL